MNATISPPLSYFFNIEIIRLGCLLSDLCSKQPKESVSCMVCKINFKGHTNKIIVNCVLTHLPITPFFHMVLFLK